MKQKKYKVRWRIERRVTLPGETFGWDENLQRFSAFPSPASTSWKLRIGISLNEERIAECLETGRSLSSDEPVSILNIEVEATDRYFAMQHEIASEIYRRICGMSEAGMTREKRLRMFRAKRARGEDPFKTKRKGNMCMKDACAILRDLRDAGCVLATPKHFLRHYRGVPAHDPPTYIADLFAKDWQLRAMARILMLEHRPGQWETIMRASQERLTRMHARLLKPYKRMLAERKISMRTASAVSHMTNECQQVLLNSQRWWLSSRDVVLRWECYTSITSAIRRAGRKPSRDLTNPTFKEVKACAGDNLAEYMIFVRRFIAAGGVPPTSMRGLRQLSKDLHDPTSTAFRFMNGDVERPFYVLGESLPALPDIKVDNVRLFMKGEDWAEEGKEMKHCIAMYRGHMGLFAHIDRGDEKATLFVDSAGRSYQCYGVQNSVNDLTMDITREWLPTIRDWIRPERFKKITPDCVNKLTQPTYE